MKYIWNEGITDPRLNLALEEYALRTFRDDDGYLLFYVNAPAIILGRNQNAIEEIDTRAVRDRRIQVVRRISGGGAVYHDGGNLNFSIIGRYDRKRFNRYDEVTRPVVQVLQGLGLEARLGGRNDIEVEGRKVSGNAQFAADGRMLSHGTLLIDTDLDVLTQVLRPRPGKLESKGARSVRSRVANIAEFQADAVRPDDLRRLILDQMFGSDVAEATRLLTPQDWAQVRALAERKYGAWSWNYGESPHFNVQRSHRFASGEVDLRLGVERGRIVQARILGDFMGQSPVSAVERRLIGTRYDLGAVEAALDGLDANDIVAGVSTRELADLVAG